MKVLNIGSMNLDLVYAVDHIVQPGETEELTLTFDLKEFASYRESDGCYVLEKGEYLLRLGNSSRNTVPVGVIVLEQEVIVSRHDHVCPLRAPMEELEALLSNYAVGDTVRIIIYRGGYQYSTELTLHESKG